MTLQTANHQQLWSDHDQAWRHPAEALSQWANIQEISPALFECTIRGDWVDILVRRDITLFVTREYEHMIIGLGVEGSAMRTSYLPLPHPSGLAADRDSNRLYVASTRNPNQIWQLAAVSATIPRLDVACPAPTDRPLIPVTAKFLPGCSYIHDLALINGQLFANSVGQNAVVCLGQDDTPVRVWWPRCIETKDGPVFGQNHIQLNSIAAGATIDQSFFSASSDQITTKRPGDPDYPVDRRGVVFSGATREPIVRGLTRPHSARLHENKLWLANSGYGEFGCIVDSEFCTVSKLPGWTRGLCFVDDIAFVGTSRVLPRFRQYAPGLDIDSSQCGIHAIDIKSGNLLGSITWPAGNQIFSIEWLSARTTAGLPFDLACPKNARSDLFYCYDPA